MVLYGAHGDSRRMPLPGNTQGSSKRGVLCCRWQSAPSLLSARARLRERPNVLLQGLELLVTVLLVRNRQPPPTVAAGVPHAELAAELISLPSGLLAMVCEAIMKLKVRLGAAGVPARACRLHGRWETADEVPA